MDKLMSVSTILSDLKDVSSTSRPFVNNALPSYAQPPPPPPPPPPPAPASVVVSEASTQHYTQPEYTRFVKLFLSGLHLAYDSFHMSSIQVELVGYEHTNDYMRTQTTDIHSQLELVKNAVDRQANFQIPSLADESTKLLKSIGRANPLNVEILSYFVASFGSHLTALTFHGKRRPREFYFGMQTYRGLIAGTQTPDQIFRTISRLLDLSELTGGRIVTASITSEEDLKATAVAVAAFFKVARLFGVKTCALTDRKLQAGESSSLSIRFEGRYSLVDYERFSHTEVSHKDVVRQTKKNVYILGPNGAGKSSWGNLISGDEVFEVGSSDHTTMIPQACEVQNSFGYRLWDTPGLFDGSEEQILMEEYIDHVIRMNAYCSGVLFVFNGSMPANEGTKKILKFAIDQFGEPVKTNFAAIINDFYDQGYKYKETYSELMYRCGYVETANNVIISSPNASHRHDVFTIRMMLGRFKPRMVARHFNAYRNFVKAHGDLRGAVRSLYLHGRQELEQILSRGKIEIVKYKPGASNRNGSTKKDVIIFRQHSRNLLMRRLGLGKDKVVEERSVLLKGSNFFKTTIRAQLSNEYFMAQVNIFLRHILSKDRYILIHTPNGECDYELRDATSMQDEELQELIARELIDEMKEDSSENLTEELSQQSLQ